MFTASSTVRGEGSWREEELGITASKHAKEVYLLLSLIVIVTRVVMVLLVLARMGTIMCVIKAVLVTALKAVPVMVIRVVRVTLPVDDGDEGVVGETGLIVVTVMVKVRMVLMGCHWVCGGNDGEDECTAYGGADGCHGDVIGEDDADRDGVCHGGVVGDEGVAVVVGWGEATVIMAWPRCSRLSLSLVLNCDIARCCHGDGMW